MQPNLHGYHFRAESVKTVIGVLIAILTVAVLPKSAQAQSACATPFFKLLIIGQ